LMCFSPCSYVVVLSCPLLLCHLFVSKHTASSEIYTLSLHDALPILRELINASLLDAALYSDSNNFNSFIEASYSLLVSEYDIARSEEHTSELQSRFDLVCRLLLEKKK